MNHPEQTRVIATLDLDGRADYREYLVDRDVVLDEDGQPAYLASQLWGTSEGTATVGEEISPEPVTVPWFPGPGAVRFRLFTFQPMTKNLDTPAEEDVRITEVSAEPSNFLEAYDSDRPGMHISDSVDFVHVLSGEIVLELERREVLLKPGDIVVMRGTWHKWRNEGTEPCTVSSVMVGATRVAPKTGATESAPAERGGQR